MRAHLILAPTVLAVLSVAALAQPLSGPPADPQLQFSTPAPAGEATPDKVETRLGSDVVTAKEMAVATAARTNGQTSMASV